MVATVMTVVVVCSGSSVFVGSTKKGVSEENVERLIRDSKGGPISKSQMAADEKYILARAWYQKEVLGEGDGQGLKNHF